MKNDISIRLATLKDADILHDFHSDIYARENSFSQAVVSKSDHQIWLNEALSDSNRILLLGIDLQSKEPIGLVRVDITDDNYFGEVSINIGAKWRSKKLSVSLLNKAIDEVGKTHTLVLIARIIPTNVVSQKCFQKCGFALYEENSDELIYQNKVLVINQIETVRSKNNVNWMNLMRLAFRVAPKEAEEIFKHINTDDGTIATLLNKLTKSFN